MKKIISLLMTAVILLSAMPGVYATEITTDVAVTPSFGVYNAKYPGEKVSDEEFVVYKNSSSTGVPSLSVNFPDAVKGTNATAKYPSAKWYKIDFDLNMKVDHKFSFLFRYSFTQNSAYIPNYYDLEKGILTKSDVPVKAGEKLHLSFLYDLQGNVRYFFINNQLVTFQKMTTDGIGNLLYINMSSAPTTDPLESGAKLPIFSITNAKGRLYNSDTTIEDMGLYNWMYSETQTEDGYSYDVVASWQGYAAFQDNMSSAPTTATLESGAKLPIFSITNAKGRLYNNDTTIEDMGLYNWMYSETQTEDGYSYDVVASWQGYAAFQDTTTIANKMGAYVAGFDSEGKLVDISSFLLMNGTTQKMTIMSDTKIDEIKVFVWGGTSSDNIFGELVPVLPSMNAMKVQSLKPTTSGFVVQAN